MDVVALLTLLIVDASFSWVRMFIALFVSMIISIFLGVYIATNGLAEKLLLPVIDILQTLPILAFFPVVIYIFVGYLPMYIGVNSAVIFLIITSMLWNMILGVYEAAKTLPVEIGEITQIYQFNYWQRMRKVFIPASFPRLVEQSKLSWAIGLFYLVTSEIFSTGNANYAVKYGIGAELVKLAAPPLSLAAYGLGLLVFVAFVIATIFLFFRPLEFRVTRYAKGKATPPKQPGRLRRVKVIGWAQRRFITSADRLKFRGVNIKGFEDTGRAYMRKISRSRGYKMTMSLLRLYVVIIALLLAAIVILVVNFLMRPTFLPSEFTVLQNLAFSFVRIWGAYLLIVIISVPLCIYLVFMSKYSARYLIVFQILASVPATVLLPIIVSSLHGHPEVVAFIIFFLSGIWYVIFGIMSNATGLSHSVFEVRDLFGVKGENAWKNVYLKAILPGLITGSMTGIAAEWNASIVAEFFTNAGISGSAVISSVHIGIGRLLDLSLSAAPGTVINGVVVNQPLLLMAIALINLTVMIVLINTFVWKRLYKSVAEVTTCSASSSS